MGERRPAVGVIGLDPQEAIVEAFAGTEPVRLQPPVQRGEVGRVGIARGRLFARLRQPFEPELADRFQHQVAGDAARSRLVPQQAVVHERGDAVERQEDRRKRIRTHPVWSRRSAAPTASAASSVKPPTKTARRRKSDLLVARQQVVAPGDRVAHRPLALGRVAPAPGQQRQPPRQAGQQGRRREEGAPGGGQLDRQRQPVQPVADGRHRPGVLVREGERGVGRPRPVDEEPDRGDSGQLVRRRQPVRVGHRQGRHGHDVLAGEAQGGPAGGQDRQARAPGSGDR